MPDYRKNKIHCENFKSEIEITVELLSGKWIVLLLSNLAQDEVVRFNEFRKNFPDITQKVLSQQLKKLEDYGLVEKEIYNEIPPKVEYRLTTIGKDLIPLLDQMHTWGERYLKQRNS